MAHHTSRDFFSGPLLSGPATTAIDPSETDLTWPFGDLIGIDRDDIRETAYEVFFTACRSSPGFGGGRNAITFYSTHHHLHDIGDSGGSGSPSASGSGSSGGGRMGSGPVVVMTPTSRIKRALGLKMLKRSPSRRMSSVAIGGGGGGGSGGSAPGSPNAPSHQSGGYSPTSMFNTVPASRPRRPLTSAEIMRLQMRVTEQSDNRLRKTLMRTLVGQMGRRAETIILPLELLRHLKPSEFNDMHEYHLWQRRQLKILEAGLLVHPAIPLEKSNSCAMHLREIILASDTKPIDTSKNSDTMKTLCNNVVTLSWRSLTGAPTDVCHWADGFPLNLHIYTCLLQAVFDFRDETLVLDEVDELLELMKKTWSTLGINRSIHNLCFTWVLFQQYVLTSQTEPDLLYAAHAMLSTERGNVFLIENLLPLALSASKILGEDVTLMEGTGKDDRKIVDSSGDRVDCYIRSSIKNAFAKVIETGSYKSTSVEVKDEASEALLQLAKETEDLALRERESFSPILKKWQSIAASVAAVTLHHCYGAVLKQYLAGMSSLNNESVEVLQRAGKLEKFLVQMVVEDSADCEDGGKTIVREMVPYEVDSVIMRVMREWIDERMKRGRESFLLMRDSETWNPKSKNEPYAQSIVELMKLAKETVDEFFEIPVGITDDLVCELAEGLEHLFQEYIKFVEACGSKQSYVPTLPPLTRCNRDSKFSVLWKIATPCSVPAEEMQQHGATEAHHPRPSTSRGTQRLYIRLNTLYYLLSHLHSLDKTLALAPRTISSARTRHASHRRHRSATSSSYFEGAQSSIQSACQHVSEVAAYRLIFLDSNSVFYETLYVGDVANARIRPALRTLKQNLTLLTAILTDRAQALAMREVMKATFEVYLMVLLAGGCSRVFYRSDHPMIQEDFENLKRVFCTCAEGLMNEEVVDREADIVEGVVTLMGECTEQLMEDFSIVTCETSGIGVVGTGQKLPMPPTTGRWNRSDPNTILRVLCHRNDKAANQFLKKTFQLAKRK
ncbi:hypothetical protein GH714_005341 [Hevea brasiliensis]|uniref:MHD1 domain-containing protein n=1 Tax=Hevea brasiliensis TaxID=3981 RepID=A0A6A6K9P6_HEVBR|nr:hypothetical protein GH714_005341 [Hevea brasiliensis]